MKKPKKPRKIKVDWDNFQLPKQSGLMAPDAGQPKLVRLTKLRAPDAECSPGDPRRFGAMIDAQIEARLKAKSKAK